MIKHVKRVILGAIIVVVGLAGLVGFLWVRENHPMMILVPVLSVCFIGIAYITGEWAEKQISAFKDSTSDET